MKGIHDGDLLMDRDGRVDGIVGGDVIVGPGCRVEIAGIVDGNVLVEPGAQAHVSGIVGGRVIHRGGGTHVTGTHVTGAHITGIVGGRD